ncbi:MAG: chromosome segregation protein SMC [Zetaproteobacteria bacterium CG12_big_fil_rev_8_21_14_0_65_54_13]|nr:MAG: chromosome segregation protein SMC [Zetaproteobacteria bacterium CG12_big_fil_rev_8_21_14_0_65_54_13]PIX54232.1 MAG: chromosome segregation protein SMC [Zetaproteobacteria bacterium CG_4_10_14_3_um_filter_54_28]PJA29084.1 MAG: chromosome segregation protein SMC [Zetaproteobacteria bacterium CG_4_9_14_3_um_filter_54_145]
MRLKRIELAGFKSFVDPTRIELGEGITAIVGPNGCGKSNIIDALRWVLGEHSARHLRGGVMDDLIFQGSDTRPPVSVCDVELTFTVEQGALAPPYHELEEISVRRRMVREGGSDAFINGKMVRLKDIIDLFLDTGISTRAYAIVEQGSIARMVTARPEERRVIFEEAAGVMKYRTRRREAERRMKDTRQNLDRVLDLLEEVRAQCRSLKQQASRAERFRSMQDEMAHLQSLALALRYAALQENSAGIEQQLSRARHDEAEAVGRLSGCERVSIEARAQVQLFDEQAQEIQQQLRVAEQQRADLQQQAERMAGERRLLSERQHALEARIEEGNAHIRRVTGDLEQAQAALDLQDDTLLQAERTEAATAVQNALQGYRQQSAERDRLLAEYERLKHDREQIEQRREQAAAAMQRLAQRQEQLDEQLKQTQHQQRSVSHRLSESEQLLNTALQTQAESRDVLALATEELECCRQAREQAACSLAEAEALLRERTGLVLELAARTRSQDVPDALRDTLKGQGAVWMDEALHVPEGLEAAVAAALRGRSADALVPADHDRDQWPSLIEQASAAPVAIFVADRQRSPLTTTPDGGRLLADAIGLSADDPLRAVFSPVFLVERIEQAVGSGVACVSRDGWRYEPEGWLVPPVGNRTARRMAMKRQLTEQQQLQDAAGQALAVVRASFAQAEARLARQQQQWQQAHLDKSSGDSGAQTAAATVAQLQVELTAQDQRLQRLLVDLDDVTKQQRHWQQQFEQAQDIDDGKLNRAKAALDERHTQMQICEQGLNQARSLLAASEQSLALFVQATDNLRQQLQRLLDERERLLAQRESDTDRLARVALELLQANRHSDLDAQIDAAAGRVEQAHIAMNHVRQQGHEQQQHAHAAEQAERHARDLRQQRAMACQRIELALAQDVTRLQELESEIKQRCRQTAAALLAAVDIAGADAEVVMTRSRDLGERLARFGPVNLLAIGEFEQAGERERFLAGQAADLDASLSTLNDTIVRIDRTTRQRFREVFDQTNAIFQQTFPQLFGGGRAQLRLDSDDVLTAGVEVIAQPPGKCLQDIGLLSGGEKALTAVALVFAIFRIKPAPFCVLDEVDAPLDDANVGRFCDMIRDLADRVQFMAITHNKITMQKADRLVGVSMPEPGVSRMIAVEMEREPG